MRRAVAALACGVAVALALPACGPSVSVDLDPSADFSSFRSYAWLAPPPPTGADRIANSPLMEKRVHAAADEHLRSRGFRLVPEGEADFLLTYFVAVTDRTREVPTSSGYSRAWPGTSTRTENFEEGSLILDVVRRSDRQLVWRGVLSRRLEEDPSPERVTEIVTDAVNRILSEFPPQEE